MQVGQNLDGYWTCQRMCQQILALIAIHELTSEPFRPMLMIFDNSTGHAAYDGGALLASRIALKPGGGQAILDNFSDDNGNPVRTTFGVGDELRFKTHVYAAKTPEQLEAERVEVEKPEADKDPNYKKPKHGSSLGTFSAGTVVQATGPTAGLIGQAKGGRQLLMEMGLWDVPGEESVRVLECKVCKNERAAAKEAITAFNRGGEGRQQALEAAAREDEDGGGDDNSAGGGATTGRLATVSARRGVAAAS